MSFSQVLATTNSVQTRCIAKGEALKNQGGSRTEPEPETGTVRTVFPETESGTGTVLSFKNVLKHGKTLFVEEPPEPKTGTDRTFPPPKP